MTIRIALVGFGQIARAEHLPAICADNRFSLAAVVTRGGEPHLGVPCFSDFRAMLQDMAGRIDAVALCTPPAVRHDIARQAIGQGLAVLLEKPPSVTLGEIAELERMARHNGTALYTAWHSQHAAGVSGAARVIAGHDIASLHIAWREDVRKWHPGQQWIWEAGGFGVFDPGINAFSIASRICAFPLLVEKARLLVPANRQAPIAAKIVFAGIDRTAEFDWRANGDEEWSISLTTVAGTTIELRQAGAYLLIDGQHQTSSSFGEYQSIYNRFADIVRDRLVEVDAEPLRITADVFLAGHRESVDAFVD